MGVFSAIRDRFARKAPLAVQSSDRVAKMVESMRVQLQKGTYDAARHSPDFARYWANADSYDADSANSREVRQTLIQRSRYELANNGYANGIVQTYATDLVGNAPSLRMQTSSPGFNRTIEIQWDLWCKAIGFRGKLWTMAHAKVGDGEAFGVIRRNPRINHPVALDLVLHEAEQCQTPSLGFGEPNYIDGIKFDEFGNPVWYDFLSYHPGATGNVVLDLKPERVPADFVLHWFKRRRPGQHRGVPEMSSTLQLGAAFRRLREANLSTAEKVAAWTLFLKTMFQPTEEEAEAVDAMSQLEIVHGMITSLPNTVEPFQLSAEHPGPQFGEFHRLLLNEQSRPLDMPANKAGCDSSNYNYASGRLDHQTYYAGLDVSREDCNDVVLEPLFSVWFPVAVKAFGWLGGEPSVIGPGARAHKWDWPKHRVADVESEANANRTKLESGQITLPQLYSEAGLDFRDEAEKTAAEFGVPVEDILKRLLDATLKPTIASVTQNNAPPSTEALAAILRDMNRRGLLNLNGATAHAN